MVTLLMNIHKTNTAAITLPGAAQLNVIVLLKFCSELLTQWDVYFFAALTVWFGIHSPTGFTFEALVMHACFGLE